MASPGHSTQRSRRVAAAVGLTAALAGGSAAVAIAGGLDATIIGHTPSAPKPACPTPNVENPPPEKACQVMGRVTGFQLSADGRRNPYRVRRAGRIVAWSVDLSRPKPSQRRFFGKFYRSEGFGTAPSARIAVIEPKGKRRYKLKRHGPAVGLNEHLGETPIFTLANPLSIKKGEILALTVPSWISDFAVGQSRRNAWRASRRKNQCAGNTDIKNSRPHEKVGSNRVYGCTYRTARLLYWGYYTTGG
jgi:hypothetical protein